MHSNTYNVFKSSISNDYHEINTINGIVYKINDYKLKMQIYFGKNYQKTIIWHLGILTK